MHVSTPPCRVGYARTTVTSSARVDSREEKNDSHNIESLRANVGLRDWNDRFEELLASAGDPFGQGGSGTDLSSEPIPFNSASSPSLAQRAEQARLRREAEARKENQQQFIHVFPLPEDSLVYGDPQAARIAEQRRAIADARRVRTEAAEQRREAEQKQRRRVARGHRPVAQVEPIYSLAATAATPQPAGSVVHAASTSSSAASTSARSRATPVRRSTVASSSSVRPDAVLDLLHARQLAMLEMEPESVLMGHPPIIPVPAPIPSARVVPASSSPPVQLVTPIVSHPSQAQPSAAQSQFPDLSYDQLLALDDSVPKPRLTPEQLAELQKLARPVSATKKVTPSDSTSAAAAAPECSICLCELVAGESEVKLICDHSFHTPCIKQWLSEHTDCPLCRTNVKHAMKQRFGAQRMTSQANDGRPGATPVRSRVQR